MQNLPKSEALLTLEDRLNLVDYKKLSLEYIPTEFALEFLTFIKLVNGAAGEENASPPMHMDMLDQLVKDRNNLFVSFRGSSKSSVLHEYMFLYLAVYGKIPRFGIVSVAMYVSDTMDNGVKSMRQNLEFRYNKSEFLQKYIPVIKFTDVRWEFTNVEGKKLCVRGFGASTGVRGFKEYGERPTWVGYDDLLSDKNANSPTIINDIKDIIYKAARQALHPRKRMVLWTGTPFNKKDPLYEAASSKGWNTRVYPLCEKYPCTREEFVGGWEDRFGYDFVKAEYQMLLDSGQIRAFNQELMLRIVSDEDRVILDSDIMWYQRDSVVENRGNYNFYITTDFATSEEVTGDYSTISVWAYGNTGNWFWVDGVCKRQQMSANIDDLFRLAQEYKPKSVGIEVSGQQGGFIPWLYQEMLNRNISFPLASEGNSNKPGIRPTTKLNKLKRFLIVEPWFKMKKMYFPVEFKDTPIIVEMLEELSLITMEGMKSKYDDLLDTISQLANLKTWKPSKVANLKYNNKTDIWYEEADEEESSLKSYIV